MVVRIASVFEDSGSVSLTAGSDVVVFNGGYRSGYYTVEGWVDLEGLLTASGQSVRVVERVCYDPGTGEVCRKYSEYEYTYDDVVVDGGMLHFHTRMFPNSLRYEVVLNSSVAGSVRKWFLVQDLEVL